MSRPNQNAVIGARWFVVFITFILAVSVFIGPSASAEGGGGGNPPTESGEDTLGTAPPFVQPDSLGFFETIVLYLGVIF